MANKIQLRRDTAANWTRVNPILDDGEPGIETDTNKVKYGDGNTAWASLDYASGGLTDVEGVVTFPGDLLVGTLWPNDPMPIGDKESVVWAKDDTEYLGLWWGGDQVYPDTPYGPVAGIMIGPNDDGSMTDDFTDNASPTGTRITAAINGDATTYEWTFDRDGVFTIPGEIRTEANVGNVTIGTNDGVTARNFTFSSNGSIVLPASGGQGYGSIDATNNSVSMLTNDTVNFANFSGMIIVNCHNSGCVTMYLCGGGGGSALSIGNSKGSDTGTMAHNAGIAGYTFTATENGVHVFSAIRTRTGA